MHRTELTKQWPEPFNAYLGIAKGVVGSIGGGRRKPTDNIDVAVMQALARKGKVELTMGRGLRADHPG